MVASTGWVTLANLGPLALLPMHSYPGKCWSIPGAPPWSSGGIWELALCPSEVSVSTPWWQGGAGLCWPSSCLGKCMAGHGPAAWPGAGAGATLGTPGRNALHPGSNRFIQFWSRSAGCVRSGEAAAASFPQFKPLLFSSWKTGEPWRVGQGF